MKETIFRNFKHFLPKVEFLKKTLSDTIFSTNELISLQLIDTTLPFVNTHHLQQLLQENSGAFSQGLLGFDENHRLIVYGQSCMYPVVGLWTKGLDLGSMFLKNQLSEQLKQVLTKLFLQYASSTAYQKVSFATERIKFLFVPFIAKGISPPILLVEMGDIRCAPPQQTVIEESFPIVEPPPKPGRRQSNFKLWENFLNKTSLHDRPDLQEIEERIEKLDKEYDAILLSLNKPMFNHSGQYIDDEYLKSESDVQTSNYPQQFQRLLQQQSSRQLFTGRSYQSNQKTNGHQQQLRLVTMSSNEKTLLQSKKEVKVSPLKKLKNSIYDTLEQTNKWLSSEGKRLSIGQLSQHDVNSFFADVPVIRCSHADQQLIL